MDGQRRAKQMAKTANIRFQGDCVIVDTSERRCVYKASPEPGMKPPVERANQYLRSLVHLGYEIAEVIDH